MSVFKGRIWAVASGIHLTFEFSQSTTRGTVLVNNFAEGTIADPCPVHDEEEPPVPLPMFHSMDDVVGSVLLVADPDMAFHYSSCTAELIGELYFRHDVTERTTVCTWTHNIEPSGNDYVVERKKRIPFRFPRVAVEHESYHGRHIQLRYFVRLTITRSWLPTVVHDQDVWIIAPRMDETIETAFNIRMEVGIERLLHLEMEYNKSVYFTDEPILGKIYFLDVQASLKTMMLCVQRREVMNIGASCYAETENMCTFEVMDGAGQAGECIPVRFDLKSTPGLTPSYRNAMGKFSVVYTLNLILVDEDDKKYFKTQEITLCRRKVGT